MSLFSTSIRSRVIASTSFRHIAPSTTTRLHARHYADASRESKIQTTPADPPANPAYRAGTIAKKDDSTDNGLARHHPDYEATADYRTSTFSPVPMRVMDGSEPGPSVPAAILSGAPTDLQARVVRIYRPTKPATQSGTAHTHHWLMDWDPLQKGHRWENPLMGWQSSADYMQGERIEFASKEDAIRFAHKQGYEYYVQEPNERKTVPKAYAAQFVYSAKKLKTIRTK